MDVVHVGVQTRDQTLPITENLLHFQKRNITNFIYQLFFLMGTKKCHVRVKKNKTKKQNTILNAREKCEGAPGG